MDRILGRDLSLALDQAGERLLAWAGSLADPFLLAQFAVVALLVVVAILSGGWLESRFEPAVRAVQGQRRLLRLLALILRRTRWIAAAILLGAAALAIDAAMWPRRAVLVSTAAWLVTAWVVISIVARLIRNRTLARFVAVCAWAFVAMQITGTYENFARALDEVAMQVGAVRISLLLVLKAVALIAAVLWAAIIAGNFVEQRIEANTDLNPSLRVLIGKLAKVTLVVVAFAFALTTLGIDLTALTFFSGALGIGIGFGLQKVVSNFVSGIIILMDKSIKPGDTIEVGDTFGWVQSLRSRFVSVRTRDGFSYLIPNEDFISQRVVNWSYTDTLVRIDVTFGVSYASDPHEVRRIAVEAAASVERVRDQPQPICHLTEFGDSSLNFILRFWVADPQNGLTNVRGLVLLACWDAFKAAGIDIPFPHRQLLIDKPIDVRMTAAKGGAGED